MAVKQAPESGNLGSILAGRYGVQVNLGTAALPVWTWVNGIESFTPSDKATLADDTDIYGNGYASQLATGQAHTIAISGTYKGVEDEDGTIPLDPGLAHIISRAKGMGKDNRIHLRFWRTDEVPEAREAYYSVDVQPQGGKTTDLQKFTGNLIGRGKPLDIAKPGAAPVLTVNLNGAPTITAGGFTVTVDGETTATIAYDATLAAADTAVEALTGLPADAVTVTGTPGVVYVFTFTEAANVNALSATAAALVGGGLTFTVT